MSQTPSGYNEELAQTLAQTCDKTQYADEKALTKAYKSAVMKEVNPEHL